MKFHLNKNKFSAIDGAFLVLKENSDSLAAIQTIKSSLEDCFDYVFDIRIVNCPQNSPLFIMSVFPEISVIDKIVSAVLNEEDSSATVKKLWETNKKWTIEIDKRVLGTDIIDCTNRELTSMLLHEIGHIIYSSSITNRISVILKYEIMKTKLSNKMMLKDAIFRRIMSLPILDSCVSDNLRNKSSIREEVKADTFAKKMGYSDELLSVLTKIINSPMYHNLASINSKMHKDAVFSLKTLEEFQQRKDKLAKKRLMSLRESCTSPYITSELDIFIETVFNDPVDSVSIFGGRKVTLMQERADKDIEDGYYQEFFIFKRTLKRIEPAELDYIDIKIRGISSLHDIMMITSYIHNKLDIVEYYLSILENPKLAKMYKVPHTITQLQSMKKRLLQSKEIAMNYKIPEKNKNILVSWPSGYEG